MERTNSRNKTIKRTYHLSRRANHKSFDSEEMYLMFWLHFPPDKVDLQHRHVYRLYTCLERTM